MFKSVPENKDRRQGILFICYYYLFINIFYCFQLDLFCDANFFFLSSTCPFLLLFLLFVSTEDYVIPATLWPTTKVFGRALLVGVGLLLSAVSILLPLLSLSFSLSLYFVFIFLIFVSDVFPAKLVAITRVC